MIKKILFSLTILAMLLSLQSQEWNLDFSTALEKAKSEDKNLLLVFQGSDWCIPCMKLEKNVWSSAEFIDFASKNLILVKADFPKRKNNKLSKEQEEKNELLFEKYNAPGSFPYVVIFDQRGEIIATTGYKDISAKEYVVHLQSLLPQSTNKKNNYSRKLSLMGSSFSITVVAESQLKADTYIDLAVNEISRIENLISSWKESSETTEINKAAGIKAIKVDNELLMLIKRSLMISKLTSGAFDISYASMDKIWKYDGSMTQLPSKDEIAESIAKVGYNNIIIDEEKSTVFLKLKGMKIGFGGIGKGYAADQAKKLLIAQGVSGGIINASGDMNTWGKQANGEDWLVAITNPLNKEHAFGLFPISNRAVVTSGDYEKFVEFAGKKYSHIIDPRTGYPASGIISTTVFADSAEMADALATSMIVLGQEVGLNLINQLPNTECILVDNEGNVFKSHNIRINEK